MNNPEIDDIVQNGSRLNRFPHGRDADVEVVLNINS